MSETILVTGATGKIGSRLVKLLTDDGTARVRAGVRNPDKAKDLLPASAHLIHLDFNQPGTIETAIAGVDRMFLLTPFDMSMTVHANEALAAASAGVKQIVRLSAIGTELEPGVTLTRLHRSVEMAIMGSQIDYTLLRPNGFMENFEANASTIKGQGVFYLPLENASIGWIDPDDIAAVAATVLLESGDQYIGRAYDLTGPESLTCDQIAAIFSDTLEKDVEYMSVPDDAAKGSLIAAGMPEQLVDTLIELMQLYRSGAISYTTNAVAEITGKPATTFAQYAAKNADKYR